MKDKVILISVIVNIVLLFVCVCLFVGYSDMIGKWKAEVSNRKELLGRNDTMKDRCRTLELSANELKSSCDSFATSIADMQKRLSIKDRKMEQAQYMASVSHKMDTVTFRDTVFRTDVSIDTSIGDTWIRHAVSLKYPSKLTVTSEVRSEKTVIMHTERETVNTPKRFFLFRWFQRRHKVTVVEVNEANPYIVSTENRFIKIHR